MICVGRSTSAESKEWSERVTRRLELDVLVVDLLQASPRDREEKQRREEDVV